MQHAILAHFPAHVYALTLVIDPDTLLADEEILAVLAARGFRLIAEDDPVALRYALSQGPRASAASPVIVVTPGSLADLPYDLWQEGRYVELALHRFFPRLDYPTLRLLTPSQRRRLAEAYDRTPSPATLAPGQTAAYLLRHVFAADLNELVQPGRLLLWLANHHAQADSLPAPVAAELLGSLSRLPVYRDWPLADLLADRAAFTDYVQSAWRATTQILAENKASYCAGTPAFADDPSLQAVLPELIRRGVVTPVALAQPGDTPAWSMPGVVVDADAAVVRSLDEGLADVQEQLVIAPQRWAGWQAVAQRWAALTLMRAMATALLPESLNTTFRSVHHALNSAFAGWLDTGYGLLAGQMLPEPHHLYHVPRFLAHRLQDGQKVALLVLDGMSLAAWHQIRQAWQGRHADWHFDERLLLAQIPSVTAVSRQALISGLPPHRFADTLLHNQQEPAHWRRFWQGQGVAEQAVAYARSPARSPRPAPAALDDHRTTAFCLVLPDIDDQVHGATLGLAEVHRGIDLWLSGTGAQQGSPWLEAVIGRLLASGYLVAITSDHGHTEAIGIGQPREGVLVSSRAKRARLYEEEAFAAAVHDSYANTRLWYDDGVLPSGWWALLPDDGSAFATPGALVVSHGGLTLEELVVPLVLVERSS